MIFGKQMMNFFSKRANPPKGAKNSFEKEKKIGYRGANEKKPRRTSMQKIKTIMRKKTAKKGKR